MPKKPKILTQLRIDEISSVDRGAGEGVKILLMKRLDDDDTPRRPDFRKWFKGIDFTKVSINSPAIDDDDDDQTVSPDNKVEQLISFLLEITPNVSREDCIYYLLHNAHGRALLAAVGKNIEKEEPTMSQSRTEILADLAKRISENSGTIHVMAKNIVTSGTTALTEHEFTAALTEHAKLYKRAGESVMGAFSRIFSDDVEIRKAHAICKSAARMMSMQPTQVGGADALDTNNDQSKALKQLQEMAAEQVKRSPTLTIDQAFARVFEDPANSELAAKAHRRPTPTTSYPFPAR